VDLPTFSILLTCGQVYSEARTLAWKSTGFVVRADNKNVALRFSELSVDLQRATSIAHAYIRQPLSNILVRTEQHLFGKITKFDLDLQRVSPLKLVLGGQEFPGARCGQEVIKAVNNMPFLEAIGVLFWTREEMGDYTLEMLEGMLMESRNTAAFISVQRPADQFFGDPFTTLLVKSRHDTSERKIALSLL